LYFVLLGLTLLTSSSCNPRFDSEKIAEVDGAVITRTDLNQSAGKALANAREQLYKLERQKLDEYIGATLLTREAKNRNVSVTTLLEQEVDGKVAPVTDEEVREFYESHKDRLRVEYVKAREQIRTYLRERRLQERKALLVSSIRSKASIKTYLTPPQMYRANLSVSGAPSKGGESAVVTLVKFEDFQCPYCKTVQPRFSELLKKYDGKIRIVHKDLPLDEIHPQARQAAEAARCAGDQGKFWEYHDRLYEGSPKAAGDDLKIYAKAIGLNVEFFERCFNSGKFKAAVQNDLAEGAQLGLSGTPAFFINGRELSGAQPLEAFTAIIDEELALAK
ncbi:MAG TPA: thioredoxin domain-containing protein, partial [Candidatus Binatia bacterium]